MPIMTSQVLKSVDFTKTQKCRYLENETIFSSNKKGHFMAKNCFVITLLTFAAMLCELSPIILCYGNKLNYIYGNEFNVNNMVAVRELL